MLAQVEVGEEANEIGAAPALLAGLHLGGTVTTMDAMLAQRGIARRILAQGGKYLMVIKANQPLTREAIVELFGVGSWLPCELGARCWRCRNFNKGHGEAKGHGKLETRTLESSTVLGGWPGTRRR